MGWRRGEILLKSATKVRKNVDLVSKFVDKLSVLRAVCGVCGVGMIPKRMNFVFWYQFMMLWE